MEQPTELDSYLEAQRSAGKLESHGHFTVDLGRARDKLARFQLPLQGLWAVRLVQAAIAAGATGCSIENTWSEARFELAGRPAWTLEAIESAFVGLEPVEEPSLHQLVTGLWAAGLVGRFPFLVALEDEALVWDGEILRRRREPQPGPPRLAVSHRNDRNPPLQRLQQLVKVLEHFLFPSPIPITLNDERLDGLHRAPFHRGCPPARFGAADAPWPGFRLPSVPPPAPGAPDSWLLEPGVWPATAGLAWGIFAHPTPQMGAFGTTVRGSFLYWLENGVVVGQEPFLAPRALSLSLQVSASGLRQDATGFKLVHDSDYQARRREALHLLLEQLEGQSAPVARRLPPMFTLDDFLGNPLRFAARQLTFSARQCLSGFNQQLSREWPALLALLAGESA